VLCATETACEDNTDWLPEDCEDSSTGLLAEEEEDTETDTDSDSETEDEDCYGEEEESWDSLPIDPASCKL
jgi:hypothetical protein